ncbi:hypothetical protein DKT77_13320 [Meridianimarinicoccus roseus]|uniref:Glycosyltransferase n=1 Tax=Meridianimarinicoccus roseus TaxID=2072018 RepID=A0A2V2LE61_9RHOB|nr:hypothetical protein [Meridianimarinicoccus roseus]PWR02131.1 hypothetical protein DKT77_13320 [Meridianimarinicoccus roseus]
MTAESGDTAPRPLCLMLAMAARGQVVLDTVRCLVDLTQDLQRHGVPFALVSYDCADQTISRNHLTSRFLTETRFSHMLMLDSDMIFSPAAVWRLIGFGEDFVAAAYAQKSYDWERIRSLFRKMPEVGAAEIVSRSLLYNHQVADWGGQKWVPKRQNGFITVPAAGPGLALITRAVPERMVAAGVARSYPGMACLPGHRDLLWHDFWSHEPAAAGTLFGHTDQAFSHRWVQGCGGELWLDCEAEIGHVGTHRYFGCYSVRVDDDFPHS